MIRALARSAGASPMAAAPFDGTARVIADSENVLKSRERPRVMRTRTTIPGQPKRAQTETSKHDRNHHGPTPSACADRARRGSRAKTQWGSRQPRAPERSNTSTTRKFVITPGFRHPVDRCNKAGPLAKRKTPKSTASTETGRRGFRNRDDKLLIDRVRPDARGTPVHVCVVTMRGSC